MSSVSHAREVLNLKGVMGTPEFVVSLGTLLWLL